MIYTERNKAIFSPVIRRTEQTLSPSIPNTDKTLHPEIIKNDSRFYTEIITDDGSFSLITQFENAYAIDLNGQYAKDSNNVRAKAWQIFN